MKQEVLKCIDAVCYLTSEISIFTPRLSRANRNSDATTAVKDVKYYNVSCCKNTFYGRELSNIACRVDHWIIAD